MALVWSLLLAPLEILGQMPVESGSADPECVCHSNCCIDDAGSPQEPLPPPPSRVGALSDEFQLFRSRPSFETILFESVSDSQVKWRRLAPLTSIQIPLFLTCCSLLI